MKGYSASGVLSAVVKGRGGVSVSHSKNTQDCKIVRMPPPEKVVLPMQQQIVAPCEPLVKIGDEVKWEESSSGGRDLSGNPIKHPNGIALFSSKSSLKELTSGLKAALLKSGTGTTISDLGFLAL